MALKAAEFVIDAYHELWCIEKSFRTSKHDLQARPRIRPSGSPGSWSWSCAGSLARARSSALGFGPLEAPRAVPSLDSAVQPLVERRPRQVRFGSVATQ